MKKRFFPFCIILILAVVPTLTQADQASDLQAQIDQKQKEIQDLKVQEQQYQQGVNEKAAAASTLQDRIIAFNQEIQGLQNDINLNQKSIEVLSLNIQKTQIDIQAHEQSIQRNHDQVAKLLREMYVGDSENLVQLLFQYNDFSDFYNQVAYQDTLDKQLGVRLNDLKAAKAALEDQQNQLSQDKKDLQDQQQELAARQAIIEDERAQRADLLKQTRNEESAYQKQLADTQTKEQEVQRQIFDIEDKLRQTLNPNAIPQIGHGVLDWPLTNIRVTQGYGCTEFAKTSKFYPTCFHNGVDVAGPIGTPIHAARDGIVIAVEKAPYAYGKWVAIKHDDGIITLYGHMSLQAAQVGQAVSRGDIIGYVGMTGMTTGPHVHFGVYVASTFTTQPSKLAGILPIGATLNPFDYLP